MDKKYDSDVGAITMEKQLQTYRRHLDDALKKGAKIELGGKEIGATGRFFGPTVLTNVNHNMEIMVEETFGPFCPIMVVEDEERALYWANKSPYGLCGSVWSRDIKKGRALAERLQVGTVTINDCVYTHALPETPWGGVKESGVGRVHSIFGLLECVQIHHINEDRGWFPPFWWYPYTKTSYDLLDALATFLAHRNPWKRLLAGMRVIKLFFRKRSENRT